MPTTTSASLINFEAAVIGLLSIPMKVRYNISLLCELYTREPIELPLLVSEKCGGSGEGFSGISLQVHHCREFSVSLSLIAPINAPAN